MEKSEKLEKTRAMRKHRIITFAIGAVAVFFLYTVIFKPPAATSYFDEQDNDMQQQQQQHQQRGSAAIRQELPSEAVLVQKVQELDQKVRAIKATGVFMEVDPTGLAATKRLQDATRLLLSKRYGTREPYRVRVNLTFQESHPTYKTMGQHDSFVIQLASSELLPHSIFSFLEIARHWHEKKGAFHRRANHVLQVMTNGKHVQHLAFQEYSSQFPHVKGTVGYAGRPSGPHWYVSIMDNSKNHGPGSQGVQNPHEADSCFGKVIEGFDTVIVDRVRVPSGEGPGMGFLNNPKDHILIDALTILVPNPNGNGNDNDDYVEWQPSSPVQE